MIIDYAAVELLKNSYTPLGFSGDKGDYRVCIQPLMGIANVIILSDIKVFNEGVYKSLKEGIKKQVARSGYSLHCMTVIGCEDSNNLTIEENAIFKQLESEPGMLWMLDVASGKVIVPEGQPEDFYGIKSLLENAPKEGTYKSTVEGNSEKAEKKTKAGKASFEALKEIPKITLGLVLINVIVFIVCTFTGTVLYNKGGVGLSLITSPAQLYRIITSMFLHADAAHIFGNMILLYYLGEIIEKKMGWLSYVALYFFAGIWGSLATFISEIITGKPVVVIGASGAVFGLLGALLALAVFRIVNQRTMQPGRIVIVLLFVTFEGFRDTQVAVWAHVGGLISGFLFALVYALATISKNKGKEEYED